MKLKQSSVHFLIAILVGIVLVVLTRNVLISFVCAVTYFLLQVIYTSTFSTICIDATQITEVRKGIKCSNVRREDVERVVLSYAGVKMTYIFGVARRHHVLANIALKDGGVRMYEHAVKFQRYYSYTLHTQVFVDQFKTYGYPVTVDSSLEQWLQTEKEVIAMQKKINAWLLPIFFITVCILVGLGWYFKR